MTSVSQIDANQRNAARAAAAGGYANVGYNINTGTYGGNPGYGYGSYDPYAAYYAQVAQLQQQALAAQQQRQQFLQNIYKNYQQAQDAANQKNTERYNQIVNGYEDLWNRSMGYLDNQGNQERRDIQDQYQQNAGYIEQDTINRGLNNSTIRNSLLGGNMRRMDRSMGELDERLNRQRLGVDQSIVDNLYGVIERRTDSGPDLNQYISLMNALGQGGVGGGYSMFGGGGGASTFSARISDGSNGIPRGTPVDSSGQPISGGSSGGQSGGTMSMLGATASSVAPGTMQPMAAPKQAETPSTMPYNSMAYSTGHGTMIPTTPTMTTGGGTVSVGGGQPTAGQFDTYLTGGATGRAPVFQQPAGGMGATAAAGGVPASGGSSYLPTQTAAPIVGLGSGGSAARGSQPASSGRPEQRMSYQDAVRAGAYIPGGQAAYNNRGQYGLF